MAILRPNRPRRSRLSALTRSSAGGTLAVILDVRRLPELRRPQKIQRQQE
jgi:hypothetical protein